MIRYRGRNYGEDEIEFIRLLIAENPNASRWRLSKKLCEEWNWRQPNGVLRDMVCRGFMLELHRAGLIELPPAKWSNTNRSKLRKKVQLSIFDQTPVETKISQIDLKIRQVRRTPQDRLFNSLIEQFHYLGYTQPVGEHLKHIVFLDERPVACFAWSSAPRHIGCRDKFIGWDKDKRRGNINLIAYNMRFLILPWVKIPHLASHLLSRMAKVVPVDWQCIYNHPIYFLETFVDTELFAGTCYKAANWIYLGQTTGRGKNDHTHKINRSIKAVHGYPLRKDFREILCR